MTENPLILVADDDASMRSLIERILTESGYRVITATDGLSAIARLNPSIDLVVTDLRMPGATGIDVLRFACERFPQTPVIVLTAFGSIPGAVDAMRLGAFDYLAKPLPSPEALRNVVKRALAGASTQTRSALIAEDSAMLQVIETATRAAQSDATVLLLGESGTGKEVVAKLIHDKSQRREGPFVAVNCAALVDNLQESELFGHVRGAFTGADADHRGRFEQADGGTLFLDEIGETSPALQAKLLRALQERQFHPVGSESLVEVDVRLVAATNRDLKQAVSERMFREDLYYRLAVVPIELPPLRARKADIIPLAEHFLQLLARAPQRTAPPLTDEARTALLAHPWPGNVRELQNTIERCVILGGGAPITAQALGLAGAQSATPQQQTDGGTLKEMERRAIESALAAEEGNRRRAAKRLGIALRTLQYKIKEYEL